MPIKDTAQTISLTCDLCQTVHDRIPVSNGRLVQIATQSQLYLRETGGGLYGAGEPVWGC